jgi:hypothetical protein
VKLLDFSQRLMMRTSHLTPFWAAYAAAYGAALLWLVARIRKVPEVSALDLRLPRRSHCFGSSDLDLRAETAQLSAPEFFALCDRLSDVLLPSKPWRKIFDLYVFPSGEFELQKRLEDFGSQGRWLRLRGPKTAADRNYPENRRAYLGKVVSDYDFIGRELFEGSLDIHHARFIYKKTMEIHEALLARPHRSANISNGIAAQVLEAAHGPAVKGHACKASFEELAHAYTFAMAEASAVCEASSDECLADQGSKYLSFADSVAPETRGRAAESCKSAIAELCSSLDGTVRSALLGAVPGTSYEYRIYFVVREELSVDAYVNLSRAVRELFSGAKSYLKVRPDYLRLRPPLVLTPVLWRTMHHWYNSLRPVEEYYFLKRHGVMLWGDDMRGDLIEPSRVDITRSAVLAVADLRNRIWAALHLRQSHRLADLVMGRVPTLWLLLANSMVATSVGEAVSSCCESSFPHASKLETLYRRLAGRNPQDLPPVTDESWTPALESLTDWLDGLVEIATSATI